MLFQRFKQLGRAVENVQRFRTIVGVFLKYGYDDLAKRLPLPSISRWRSRKVREKQAAISQLSQPERLRRVFEELGPTFVKLGQLLASRSHLLPRAFTDELAKLHDQVPPISFADVRDILSRELKRPLEECFASIEETPIGSASIAQVHRAVLLGGQEVVLKVQRPEIEQIIRVDLQIMAQLAGLLQAHVEGWAVHRPESIVAEFARGLEQEIDFDAEAAHLERFALQFKGEPTIHVPWVHHESSTRRVLTMEYVNAFKASKLAELDAADLDRREIARRIADLVMKQVFVHGFFHADPHPGNIHILPGSVICFLDFGTMGFLDLRTRETFADLVLGIALRNERGVAAALLKLADAELDPPRPGLEADVAEFMHQHFYRPAGEMVFSKLVGNLFQLTGKHGLRMPPDLFVMMKALSLTEGLVRKLNPDHDLIAQAKPFMRQVHVSRMGPRRVLRQLAEFGGEAMSLLRELPIEVRRITAQVKGGKTRVTFRHEGLEPLDNTLERASNRLAFALVLASLIIGSSVIIHAGIPPKWHDVPLIGVVGFVFAAVMGAWLMVSILRHGKM